MLWACTLRVNAFASPGVEACTRNALLNMNSEEKVCTGKDEGRLILSRWCPLTTLEHRVESVCNVQSYHDAPSSCIYDIYCTIITLDLRAGSIATHHAEPVTRCSAHIVLELLQWPGTVRV